MWHPVAPHVAFGACWSNCVLLSAISFLEFVPVTKKG
jgi:hypothetical protein